MERLSATLLNDCQAEQSARWGAGESPLVEEFLARHPELSSDHEMMLDLIYSEVCIRAERNKHISHSEYFDRFPGLTESLARLFEVHEFFHSRIDASATRRQDQTVPDLIHMRCPACRKLVAAGESNGQITCNECKTRFPTAAALFGASTIAGGISGRFKKIKYLGGGQHGDVWLCRDTKLGRMVALKVPRVSGDRRSTNLLLREAKAAAQLHHKNVVQIYEVNETAAGIEIVSQYVHGRTLAECMSRYCDKFLEVARLCATVAEALEHAHTAGVVHRDLKPANIIIDAAGQPYVTDFGLAKHGSELSTLASPGHPLGTAAYMSPEQASGNAHQADRRSDVYSIGVILYELLTTQRPFAGSILEIMTQALSRSAVSPRHINARVPADLEYICLKAMAKEPNSRYQTAADMADDLKQFSEGKAVRIPNGARFPQPATTARLRKRVFACVAVVVALVLIGAFPRVDDDSLLEQPRELLLNHKVRIATQDSDGVALEGATVVCVPLDSAGRPRIDEIVHPNELSPLDVELSAGDWLIVATKDSVGFHEVFRRVPHDARGLGGYYNHNGWVWNADQRIVELPAVRLFPFEHKTDRLVRFEGRRNFTMGSTLIDNAPVRRLRLPPYFLAAKEVTNEEFRQSFKVTPPHLKQVPGKHAITNIDFDQAVSYAEKMGLRLPDEAEYEYAATLGSGKFPWGDDVDAMPVWQLDCPVGHPAFDRVPSTNVFGLCSNALEWTSSRALQPGVSPRFKCIVRGGPKVVLNGDFDLRDVRWGPQTRLEVTQFEQNSALGLRCARSVGPRIERSDFIREYSQDIGKAIN